MMARRFDRTTAPNVDGYRDIDPVELAAAVGKAVSYTHLTLPTILRV